MTKKQARQIANKLRIAKGLLRNLHNKLTDAPLESTGERAMVNAARQGVAASEAELQSAIFSIEMLEDMFAKKGNIRR